jgi:hypothetical protein
VYEKTAYHNETGDRRGIAILFFVAVNCSRTRKSAVEAQTSARFSSANKIRTPSIHKSAPDGHENRCLRDPSPVAVWRRGAAALRYDACEAKGHERSYSAKIGMDFHSPLYKKSPDHPWK